MPSSPRKQNDWILRTKLHRPQLPPDLVPRARLLELLEQNPGRSFTLVSSPAGYGKSTLVSRWLDGAAEAAAWLSLDEDDNDLRGFLKYFIAAVRTHSPKACRASHVYLGGAELPPAAVLAECLSNDLDAIKRRFVLVIDDYHRIREGAIHELVGHLLRHPSRKVHLVLVTRRDPPLELAGLRASGQSLEIREHDLRFSRDETRTVLETIGGVSIEGRTLAHLHEVLEGWITGLRLVCLMLRHEKDPAGFLDGLHGGTLNIRQYLVEEVLKHLPPGFEDALLKTSILNRLCGPLCEFVCADGVDTGEDFLRELERANLFAIRLDARGEWVRYHHLFQQLLQQQLEKRASAGEIAALHERASDWFESEGFREEALQHALRAGNVERAADLIEKNRVGMLDEDKWYVLERWNRLLPETIREERPGLLLIDAWSAYERFAFDRLFAILEKTEPLLDGRDPDPSVSGEWSLLRGEIEYWSGNGKSSRSYFETARATLPKRPGLVRGLLELQYGLALCMEGKRDQALESLNDRVREVDEPQGVYLSRLVAGLFFIHHLSGNLVRARTEAQRLRTVAEKSGIVYTLAWSEFMEACTYLHAHDLEPALKHMDLAVRQRYILHTRAAVDALAGLALTQQLLGRQDEATATLDMLQSFTLELGEAQYLAVADACRSRLALLRGDLAPALDWARSTDEAPTPSGLFMWLEVPPVTRARVLITDGSRASVETAVEILGETRDLGEGCRFVNQVIEVAALQALALDRLDRGDEALARLAEAMALAAPAGWVRPFVEAGTPMADLMTKLPEQPEHARFTQRVRAAHEAFRKSARRESPSPRQAEQPLIEPLTNRELDVLEHLVRRLQDKEIAESLSVSVGTVKTHLKHIYGKLAVSGRRAAVTKAEELGVI